MLSAVLPAPGSSLHCRQVPLILRHRTSCSQSEKSKTVFYRYNCNDGSSGSYVRPVEYCLPCALFHVIKFFNLFPFFFQTCASQILRHSSAGTKFVNSIEVGCLSCVYSSLAPWTVKSDGAEIVKEVHRKFCKLCRT